MAFLVVGSKLRLLGRAPVRPGFSSGWVVGEKRPGHGRQYCGKVTIKGNSRLVSVGLCKWVFVPE